MEFVYYNSTSNRRMRLPVTVLEGLSLPDVDHISVRSPRQHGSTYVATYFRPRAFSLQWALRGCDPNEFERKHRDLVQIINPLDAGELQIYDANDQIYTLPCRLSAGLVLDRFAGGQAAEVLGQFIADDPYFRSPEVRVDFSTVVQSPLVIPFAIPSAISGGASIDFAVVNNGHVKVYPRITIVGSHTDPRLTNLTTGEIFFVETAVTTFLAVDMGAKTVMHGSVSILEFASGPFWGLDPGTTTVRIEIANAAVRPGALWFDPLYLAIG